MCVRVTESTSTPTTFTTPTASTVSSVTTSPSSFTTGSIVNVLKSSSLMWHHLLCLHFAIFGGIIQYSQIQAAAIEKVDAIGGDNMTIYIEKGNIIIYWKYSAPLVCVTESSAAPTTLTTPTASTVSSVTTSPSSFTTGSIVNIL